MNRTKTHRALPAAVALVALAVLGLTLAVWLGGCSHRRPEVTGTPSAASPPAPGTTSVAAAYPYPGSTPLPPSGRPTGTLPYSYPGAGTMTPSPRAETPGLPTVPPRYLPWVLHFGWMQSPTPTVTSSPTATPTATAPPTVTPVPTRPWPVALSQPGPSKLGIHIQWNSSPDILEFVRRYRPAVVKAVDDLNFLADVKAMSPTTVTIGRIEDSSPSRDQDPAQAARDYVNRLLGTYLARPWVDYWEGINEPDVGGDMAWYAAFEAERARVMGSHGLKVAIGSFSTGVPEWADFEAFLPAVEAAAKYGGVMSLHEYDAPTMMRSVGSALPGREAVADRGALVLRYRWWYEDYLKPRGLVIPLVITEAGIDGGVTNRPGPEGGGWRDFTTYWGENGLSNDGTAFYLQQLAWYDAELRKDDYVIGCTVFTVGAIDDKWRSFDVTDMLREIGQYMVDQAAAVGIH